MSAQPDETQIEALFGGEESAGEEAAPGWVHDTMLRFDAELGSERLTADEVPGLRDGAVVVLDRAVDDPIELLVNGTPYGTGRLPLGDDEWAVLIEEIAPQNEEAAAEADESSQEEMETDSVDESVDDTEGSD